MQFLLNEYSKLAHLSEEKLSKVVDEYRNSYNMSAGDDKFDLVYDILKEVNYY